MGMRLHYITPLLAAGVAAVAIAAAPTAFAADQQSCHGSGSGTVCLSPANVPIKTHPTDVSAPPRWRHARSDGTEPRAGPRPGDVNGPRGGNRVIVTGGTSGIGLETPRARGGDPRGR
jgi:hypothetical protein